MSKTIPTMVSLEAEVREAGFTPSIAGYEDDMNICACSVESDGACYGHPLFECHYSKVTKWLRISGKPDQLIEDSRPIMARLLNH